jgi:hypothetical protein
MEIILSNIHILVHYTEVHVGFLSMQKQREFQDAHVLW